jgi:steroid 5-alpha reductase family enzyme
MPVYLVRLATHAFLALSNVSLFQVNIVPANLHPALTCRDYASLGLFAGSLLFEIIADRQKSAWRHAKRNKDHEEKFITSGLWSISRHPKYHFHFHAEVGAGLDNSFSVISVK